MNDKTSRRKSRTARCRRALPPTAEPNDRTGRLICYSPKNYKDTQIITIPKSKYAIFEVGSREQKDIVETENLIYNQWMKSTNYEISNEFNFELYIDDDCHLYIPIKDKQN